MRYRQSTLHRKNKALLTGLFFLLIHIYRGQALLLVRWGIESPWEEDWSSEMAMFYVLIDAKFSVSYLYRLFPVPFFFYFVKGSGGGRGTR